MSFSKTFSLVGSLYESDGVSRQTRDALSAATWDLVKVFEFNSDLTANSGPVSVSLEAASVAEFLFVRTDVPDGGDCSLTLTCLGNDLSIPAWSTDITYAAGDVVIQAGVYNASLAGSNTSNNPTGDGGENWRVLTLAVPTHSTLVLPCNGGEIWINKTHITAIKVSTVSGCSVSIIGGSRT